MKKIIVFICLIGINFFPQQSKASFLIDPYVGYTLAWDTPSVSGTEIDVTRNGAMYGARAGYQFLGFMAGVEYGMGSGMTWDIAAAAAAGVTSSDKSYDSTYMGVFVGYELPIMLRAWATYYFDANWEFEGGQKVELTTISFGVGFTGLPFVSLNAEYRMNTFDTKVFSLATGVNSDDYKSNGEVFFSASLPLNL